MTYSEGFNEALVSQKVVLRDCEFVSDRGRVSRAARALAENLDLKGMSHEEILAALGPPWIEFGKDYPKALGMTLISVQINPDDPKARAEALRAIHADHNPHLFRDS